MNGEAHIQAAEFMHSLIPFNPPDYPGLMWDIRTGYMERGETAMSGYWSVRSVRLTNPKEAKVANFGEVAYAPAPTVDGKPRPTYTGALSFGINNKISDREKEAAWAFIKWGTSKKIMQRLAKENLGISQFRKSVLSDKKLQKKYPYYQTLLNAQKNARRRIFHPFYADTEEIFGLELNKYMVGETKTAKSALDKACNKLNERLKRFSKKQRLRWINDIPLKL